MLLCVPLLPRKLNNGEHDENETNMAMILNDVNQLVLLLLPVTPQPRPLPLRQVVAR